MRAQVPTCSDVDRSNVVLGSDVIQVRNAQFRTTTHPQYSAFLDVNGSDTILSDDVILTRNLQFTALPSGDHDLTGPTFTAGLRNDTGLSGSDRITFDAAVGGTVNVPSGVTVLSASLNGGAFVDFLSFRNGDGTFNLNTLSSGTMSGTGQTILLGNGTINSMNLDDDCLVEIRGTTTWTGSTSQRIYFNRFAAAANGGFLRVAFGGVFDIQTDAVIDHWNGSAGSIQNFGLIKETAGTGTTSIGLQTTNNGTMRVDNGTLHFTLAFTNLGSIVVGSAGTLSVAGAFTNDVLAAIAFEIGGTNPREFGRFAVTGTATLAGSIQVSFVDGFLPSLGQTFSVLTYGSRNGTFGSISGDDAGNGIRLDPDYQTTKLDLVGVAS